jgi:hypothetical protein
MASEAQGPAYLKDLASARRPAHQDLTAATQATGATAQGTEATLPVSSKTPRQRPAEWPGWAIETFTAALGRPRKSV